jgi:four helix bundle protein
LLGISGQPQTDIPDRAAEFALRITKLYPSLPRNMGAQAIGRQLFRSGTSVGAHVRDGKHARSDAEMLSKVSVALQELEEARYWIDLLCKAGFVHRDKVVGLLSEADQLTAILFTSVRTLRRRIAPPPQKIPAP